MVHYPRGDLAEQLVQALQGKNLFGDVHNGLFLAAPRRTGKSTFLQVDLKPALEKQGVVVVYVDLWANLRQDPGALIADAIGKTIEGRRHPVTKALKTSPLSSVSIPGLIEIDTTKIGAINGNTLHDSLGNLHLLTKSPVALIIDEAQHALTSEAGEAAMAALKSARDQLNSPGEINLMLIMSGSDRDKLLRLVNTSGAPFYGSQIKAMPELDEGFISFVACLVETQRPDLAPVDTKILGQAFRLFGNRPQFFMEALGQTLSPLSNSEGKFEVSVLQAASQRQSDDETQMESEYLGLRPLERAILWRLLSAGSRFRPYDAEALAFYLTCTGEKASAAKVQNALEALRQRTPAMVWKSARGEYAVDDASMHRWYQKRIAENTWPPR